MERAILVLLLLAICISLSKQQRFARCLLSRHVDKMPCQYRNPRLERAGVNQYSIHYTNLKSSGSGGIECRVRPPNQVRGEITILGTENSKFIFSPGIGKKEPIPYDNQLLCQYNIDCGEGRLAFFNVTKLNLQGRDCPDGNVMRCQDYILIDRGTGGTTEICGNTTSDDSVLELQSRSFTVFFRSSEEEKYGGFEMYVVCFEPEKRNLEGCLTPMDFNSSVCTNGTSGDGSGNISNRDNSAANRTKRDVYADVTYKDIFPEYPEGLKMREDVFDFHSQWLRRRRQARLDMRDINRIVFFNETVNYTDSTITIKDNDGVVTGMFKDVLILQTFDAEGMIGIHFMNAQVERLPHFLGPGPLRIVDRYAYFQLFIIDPRGLIPNEEEEVELEQLNESLFGSVPPDNATFNATDLVIEDFSALGIPGLEKRSVRERRDISYPFDDHQSKERVRRQEIEVPTGTNLTVEALYNALRNREACNPVLRQQATSLISIFKKDASEILEENINFGINCTIENRELRCMVEEGSAPALDKGNYCTVNNGTPKECDPFYRTFVLKEEAKCVTVEAINCNGQRATLKVGDCKMA